MRERVDGLTVLYDAGCPLCTRFRGWLESQALLVPLAVVAAGSDEARRRFPTLDHAHTLVDITVVGDDGSVWTREHAWVMCLWATRAHRALAERLATPRWLPLARGAAYSAAGVRSLMHSGAAAGGDYPERCAGTCSPNAQG